MEPLPLTDLYGVPLFFWVLLTGSVVSLAIYYIGKEPTWRTKHRDK